MLLQKDPEKRLGAKNDAEDIKKHPFFAKINWEDVYNKRYKLPKPKRVLPLIPSMDQDLKITFSTNDDIKRNLKV